MTNFTYKKWAFLFNAIFVAFWLVVLFSGMAFKVSAKVIGWPDWSRYALTENRELAPKPDFRKTPVKKWGSSVEAWYNDNFAWRSSLILFYRQVHFSWLKTAVGREVPGLDGWVFRRGGDWAELDDYLGGFELTEKEMDDWLDFFEGRKQWAEAHGALYIQLVSSVKAQIECDKVFPSIRNHRGVSMREQLQKRLAGSPTARHMVFTHDCLTEAAAKREVFYPEDHHVNAYGIYLLYNELVKRLSDWFPGIAAVPFYDHPPEAVLKGTQAGCYEKDRRLVVVVPGSKQVDHPTLAVAATRFHFPMVGIAVKQPGAERSIVMGNDSMMRYALSSWNRNEGGKVAFPFGAGFDDIVSLIFLRFSTGQLDYVVSEKVPDVIIEQFAECKLSLGTFGLDTPIRRAAEFERGVPLEGKPKTGETVLPRCVLDDVTDESGKTKFVRIGQDAPQITVELLEGTNVVDSVTILPGVKRAVFFKSVKATGGEFSITLTGGRYSSSDIKLRLPVPRHD